MLHLVEDDLTDVLVGHALEQRRRQKYPRAEESRNTRRTYLIAQTELRFPRRYPPRRQLKKLCEIFADRKSVGARRDLVQAKGAPYQLRGSIDRQHGPYSDQRQRPGE